MNDKLGLVIVPLIAAFVALPLLLYHFLFFPNLDGMMQDISWYNYDEESGHFLYWVGFYTSAFIGGILGASLKNGS